MLVIQFHIVSYNYYLTSNLLFWFCDCVCWLSDFSNVVSKQDVKTLAEADDQEVVREVQVLTHNLGPVFTLHYSHTTWGLSVHNTTHTLPGACLYTTLLTHNLGPVCTLHY